MGAGGIKIGVVAPASRLDAAVAERTIALARSLYPDRPPELRFHPQCFLSSGHFAGDDETRARAFLEMANDPGIDAVWFARGGYGSGRLAARVLAGLTPLAACKTYLGYSDVGALMAALYTVGFTGLAHGPMPADLKRDGGEAAVKRALAYLVERAPSALEPTVSTGSLTAAFNITMLSHLIGTPWQPDLRGHVLMLEDVSEHVYRIDRAVWHIIVNPAMRGVAGIRLGRCSAIPPNEPDFGETPEQVVRHWCDVSGIPYLGPADIGHDVDNKVVPLGRLTS
ncbi:MAG TPA: LD-carboxypeptidase [Stellaceae bacterium]|nr:LD-carboxypeptidase [Stellaceae bacterium]